MRFDKREYKKLNRRQFEALIGPGWTEDGKAHHNPPFKTWVWPGWKYVSDGEVILRARTWREIANKLELT